MQRLSKRLLAAASLVPEGAVLADVGTDHGFLPIYLCQEGWIRRAIAMDIAKGPLKRAGSHILEADLAERIEIRLSDGLAALRPGEADTVSALGMGGALIMRMITDRDPRELGIHTLVLGPQSEVKNLRCFLLQRGFSMERELLVEESGKFYFLLQVRTDRKEETPYTEAELLFGRSLLAGTGAELSSFLFRRKEVLEEIRRELSQTKSAAGVQRLSEVEEELSIIKEIQNG